VYFCCASLHTHGKDLSVIHRRDRLQAVRLIRYRIILPAQTISQHQTIGHVPLVLSIKLILKIAIIPRSPGPKILRSAVPNVIEVREHLCETAEDERKRRIPFANNSKVLEDIARPEIAGGRIQTDDESAQTESWKIKIIDLPGGLI